MEIFRIVIYGGDERKAQQAMSDRHRHLSLLMNGLIECFENVVSRWLMDGISLWALVVLANEECLRSCCLITLESENIFFIQTFFSLEFFISYSFLCNNS